MGNLKQTANEQGEVQGETGLAGIGGVFFGDKG
jgi:hypothetical protein